MERIFQRALARMWEISKLVLAEVRRGVFWPPDRDSIDSGGRTPYVSDTDAFAGAKERSGPVSQVPTVVAPERRKWLPMQTVTWLVLNADEDRAQELRALGETYFENVLSRPLDVSRDSLATCYCPPESPSQTQRSCPQVLA